MVPVEELEQTEEGVDILLLGKQGLEESQLKSNVWHTDNLCGIIWQWSI